MIILISLLSAGCTSAADSVVPRSGGVVVDACSTAGPDSDQDGIPDSCEQELAQRFAPVLNASAEACNAVPRGTPTELAGGYRYVVAPFGSGIRVAYLPAYFVDCGWSGPKCRVPGINCAPHNGDSELIVVELEPDPGWRVTGVFLSAHCFGRSQGSCRWYRGRALAEFEWPAQAAGGPMIWVANGRNANYPSRAACEAGHWWVDTCAGTRMTYRFPVHASANLGSRAVPATAQGCVAAAVVDPAASATAAGAVECFWDDGARFRGWQRDGRGVTPYSRYLREVAGQ